MSQAQRVDGAVIHVGDDGIRLPRTVTAILDVLFDGQRTWSFHPERDGKVRPGGITIAWPPPLKPFLDGRSVVVVREHVSERVLFEQTVSFGSADTPVSIVDKRGDSLAVDKSGRLVRTFSDSAGANLDELMDETDRLLAVLDQEGGVPSYLCYGGLLGAVRTGHMIGHDSDMDISYLSNETRPADIMLESFRLERLVRRHGWSTRRMSGADFKVLATMKDASSIGIDVFGSYYVDGVYHLMGEIRGELPRESIVPVSTVSLEGRQIQAPADPEALLALTYGEGWRVPDPAYKFLTPETTRRRLTGWMRGERAHLRFWDRLYNAQEGEEGNDDPSPFAQWVAKRLPAESRLVELGAGTGRDAAYFAQLGHHVVAFDYSGSALRQARRRAQAEERLRVIRLNLYESREVLTHAALRAHRGTTDAIFARHVLDALREDGRRNFWTYVKMVLRAGGLLHLEFRVPDRPGKPPVSSGPTLVLDPDVVAAEIEAAGGTVEQSDVARGQRGLRQDNQTVSRLVVRWS